MGGIVQPVEETLAEADALAMHEAEHVAEEVHEEVKGDELWKTTQASIQSLHLHQMEALEAHHLEHESLAMNLSRIETKLDRIVGSTVSQAESAPSEVAEILEEPRDVGEQVHERRNRGRLKRRKK